MKIQVGIDSLGIEYTDSFIDPYHTYLSLAALSMYQPSEQSAGAHVESWKFQPLDPLLNARQETAAWVRKYIPARNM